MLVLEKIKEKYHNYLLALEWNIGFVFSSPEDILQKDRLEIRWMKHKYKDRWFADPFILSVTENEIILLVEEKYHPINRGRISKLVVDRESLVLKQCIPVLELDTHLSFPAILRRGDDIYVYPENSEVGQLKLYHYQESEGSLSFVNILSNEPLTDSVMNTCFGFPCLVSTRLPNQNGRVLGIYEADEWDREYKLKYTVTFQDNTARSAGGIFKAGNEFIRPAQDCNKSYGRGIVFQRVEMCDGKLSFYELKRFYPSSWRYHLGLHTFNTNGEIAVVDGKGYRKPILGRFFNGLRKTIS